MSANEEPLIYTNKGNLPIKDLEVRHGWIDNENETRFVQEWWLGDEPVKRAEHVFLKKGLSVKTEVVKLR